MFEIKRLYSFISYKFLIIFISFFIGFIQPGIFSRYYDSNTFAALLLISGFLTYLAFLDMGFGKCRLSLASFKKKSSSNKPIVATKYPVSAKAFFASKFQNVEIINLKGAIEIAPILGLSDYIVDLVQTGNTLRENGLSEIEVIQNISTRLIINKSSFKTKSLKIEKLISSIKYHLNGKNKS